MPDRVLLPFACGFIGSLLGLIFSSALPDPCLSILIGTGTGGSIGCITCAISCTRNPPCKEPLPIASVVEPAINQNIFLVYTENTMPSKPSHIYMSTI